MTNHEIPSPVIQKFHSELKRLLDLESSTQAPKAVSGTRGNKVPQRRLVKLPPSTHPLFPELELS